MTGHDELKSWQKCLLLLIIGAFLITELRAISSDHMESDARALADRAAQHAAFKDMRDARDVDSKNAADDLKVAIARIKSTLARIHRTAKEVTAEPQAKLK